MVGFADGSGAGPRVGMAVRLVGTGSCPVGGTVGMLRNEMKQSWLSLLFRLDWLKGGTGW